MPILPRRLSAIVTSLLLTAALAGCDSSSGSDLSTQELGLARLGQLGVGAGGTGGVGADVGGPRSPGPGTGVPSPFNPGGAAGGGGGGGGVVTNAVAFLYLLNVNSSTISQIGVAADGQLSFLGNGVGAGQRVNLISTSPDGRFVYAADTVGDELFSYSVDLSTGLLTELTPSIATGQDPRAPVFARGGTFAYMLVNGTSIERFSVGADGRLTSLGSPTTTGGNDFSRLAVNPAGDRLYMTNEVTDHIDTFTVSATGVLGPQVSIPTGIVPREIIFHPVFDFAYVISRVDDQIEGYAVDPNNGDLTSLGLFPGTPIPTAGAAAAHPILPVLYVAEANGGIRDGELMVFNFSGAGVLSLVDSTTLPAPGRPTLTPDGAFAYVSSSTGGDKVLMFNVDQSDGTLTSFGEFGSGSLNLPSDGVSVPAASARAIRESQP